MIILLLNYDNYSASEYSIKETPRIFFTSINNQHTAIDVDINNSFVSTKKG